MEWKNNMSLMNYKKNCMSYWFPKLVQTGVPTPKTIMVDMDKVDTKFVEAMKKVFWMKEPDKEQVRALIKFRQVLEEMGHRIGYPFFLRTGQTSYKHGWFGTCFVQNQAILMKHAQEIGEHSIMADFKGGLPINVWAVRKIIETTPAFEAFHGQMPITKEMRYFFRDHKIICSHPYWPEHALEGHVHNKLNKKKTHTAKEILELKGWKKKLKKMNKLSKKDKKLLDHLTEKVALRFEGYWSIDWLKGKGGQWYAIDMATGDDSYHWKGCPNRKEQSMGNRNRPKREKKKKKKKKEKKK